MLTLDDVRYLLSLPKPHAVAALKWWKRTDPFGYAEWSLAIDAEVLRREATQCQGRCCK